MKRALIFVVLWTSLAIAGASSVYTIESVPKPSPPQTFVSNPDGVLSSATQTDIDLVLRQLYDSTTAEVTVVVLNSIGDAVPADFRRELFRYWGVGNKKNDNGLLILLVMDQRRMEFETGYGLEGVLPDILCKHIQETYMVPLAKQGDMDGAVMAGVMQVYRILNDPAYHDEIYAGALENDAYQPWWRKTANYTMLIIFAAIYFLSAILSYRGGRKSNKSAPAYVKNQYNTKYATAKFGLLNVAAPLSFFAWQEIAGNLRVFEFAIFVYSLLMVLLFEKRLRLNNFIHRDTADKLPQDTYNLLSRSHSNGWIMADIFFPIPFIFYSLINKGRMKAMRNTPPTSNSGNPMVKLDEKADDTFLKTYQLAEENIHSVDYDVWQDTISNEVQIFRFENYYSKYKECPNCKSKAYLMTKNKTIVSPTYDSTGEGEKTYNCKACGHERKERYTIAKLTRSSSSGSGGGFSGSGGGGGFGGGSSGGGGAGSSW